MIMFQLELFEPQVIPQRGETYVLENVPTYLLTESQWLEEGFIIEGDPQAWVWHNKKGYIGLYNGDKIKPKPAAQPQALEDQIADVALNLIQIQKDIARCKVDVEDAVAMKNNAPRSQLRLMNKFLSFCVGLHIQTLDEEKQLKAQLKYLRGLQKKRNRKR